MIKYVLQRILAMVITLLIITTLGFMIIRLMPGGLYEEMMDITEEQKDALEAKYHLDKPLWVQYYYFLRDILLENDWGTSMVLYPSMPVWDILKTRIPMSMYLNIFSLLISLPLGIILGITAAIKKNSIVDHGVSVGVIICISVPSFIFATLMQYFLAFKFGWTPIIYDVDAVGLAKFHSLILPIIALSLGPIARVTRYLRAELAETINSDFMLLARTKGLTERQATINHGIRNSLLPLMNTIIPMFTSILGGSMVIENIFGIPGMGGLMVKAINSLDHSVTIAILIFYSLLSLITMLIVDISYGIVDPRIRIGGKSS